MRRAAVVPPGEVTLRRSSAGARARPAASAAAPATVCSARRAASSAPSPICRPASSIASRSRRRRPGPSPRARSRRRAAASSPTQMSSPVGAEQRRRPRRGPSAGHRRRANRPAMPWPISAGVFGMARTTRSLPVAATIASLRMPAITLSCSAPADVGRARRAAALEGLRLDRPDDERGASRATAPAAAQRADAELRPTRRSALRLARLDDDDRGGRAAGLRRRPPTMAPAPCCRRR